MQRFLDARLRHLLDDRPRLSRVVRLGRLAGRRPGRLRRRLRAPDRHPLRGPRRAAARRQARRRGPRRRRTSSAAIGGSYGGGMSMALARASRPHDACPTAASSRGRARTASPMRARRRGAVHHLDRPRLLAGAERLARSTTSQTPYRGRFGVMKESLVNGLYFAGLGAPGFYAPRVPIRPPT